MSVPSPAPCVGESPHLPDADAAQRLRQQRLVIDIPLGIHKAHIADKTALNHLVLLNKTAVQCLNEQQLVAYFSLFDGNHLRFIELCP